MKLFFFLFYFVVCQETFPDTFDLREKYPECISLNRPLNQGQCGSCWSFATSGVTADRLCINGHTNQQMSAEHLIQCSTENFGCDGGYVSKALSFVQENGIVPLACKSYRELGQRRCAETCDNQERITDNIVFKIKSFRQLSNEQEIMESMLNSGSVIASYEVWGSFTSFYSSYPKTTVYCKDDKGGEFDTFHAVKIVGWGTGMNKRNEPTKYWLIQNSWGSYWADGGYFRIERGTDAFGIENAVYEPIVGPVDDKCSPFKTCESCKAATFEDGATKCGYCLTSDQCVEVDADEKPKKGMCTEMSKSTEQCPLDDCAQMSYDPLRCVSHSGCVYCGSTRKCRAGNEKGQNFGQCTSLLRTKKELIEKYPCLGIRTKQACIAANVNVTNGTDDFSKAICGWCAESGLCLDNNKWSADPEARIGECSSESLEYTLHSDPENPAVKNCTYHTKPLCDADANCTWNRVLKKCAPTDAASHSLQQQNKGRSASKQIHRNLGGRRNQANDEPIFETDDPCLMRDCSTCVSGGGCIWCHSTKSCIASWKQVTSATGSIGELTSQTTCHFPSSPYFSTNSTRSSNTLSRCDRCFGYSSCAECALQPECGWMSQMKMCIAGRTKPVVSMSSVADGQYANDSFVAYKMKCPILPVEAEGAFNIQPMTKLCALMISFILCLALKFI